MFLGYFHHSNIVYRIHCFHMSLIHANILHHLTELVSEPSFKDAAVLLWIRLLFGWRECREMGIGREPVVLLAKSQ